MPPVLEFARRAEEHVKGMVTPGTLFEEFGFNYIGPIDGHDLDVLVPTLTNLRHLDGPQFLHVVTRKGKGYKRAEDDPILYHGVTKFDPGGGHPAQAGSQADLHPDLRRLAVRHGGAGFAPDRYHAGDARRLRHGALFAGVSGSLFRRRHRRAARRDICRRARLRRDEAGGGDLLDFSAARLRPADPRRRIQNLPVVFAIDRGGLVGADGPTHHGAFDLSYLRCMPNMVVMAPSDENECRQMLYTAFQLDAARRRALSARQRTRRAVPEHAMQRAAGGQGRDTTAAAAAWQSWRSAHAQAGLEAGEKFDATVANMRFVKPLDEELLRELAANHEHLVTVEENDDPGRRRQRRPRGPGETGLQRPVLQLGLPDRFIDHGDPARLLKECGLDADGICAQSSARFIPRRSLLRYISGVYNRHPDVPRSRGALGNECPG